MERACSSSSENGYIRPRGSASKNPAVSALQDLLFYQLTGIGFFAQNAMSYNKTDKETNNKISRLIYLTNKGINFSINSMIDGINTAYTLKNRVENLYKLACKNNNKKPKHPPTSSGLRPADSLAQMVSQANVINAQKTIRTSNYNIFAMHEIIRKSLVASANYIEYIKNSETIDDSFYYQIYDILCFLSSDNTPLSECANYALKAGELHTQVLEKLIGSYEKTYGLIERKKISTSFKKGSAILVAGDDFPFLKNLLEQTKEKNINIYTYGTLNYAHTFPEINKYPNLTGIYLGKYDDFSADIENFPGVVILTSGNIEELSDIFRGRIFATEDISMLGVSHLDKNNLKPIINAAYDAQGFESNIDNCSFEIGFGLKELEYFTEKFYKDLKSKKISAIEIFLGCGDFNEEKNYINKMIKMLPKSTAFITLECLFKYKFSKNKKENYKILNLGQFANLYSLVRLLFSLSGKFRKDINEMPFDIIINLRSPNTIAALLMLLSLGIKNIKINSELPNYLTECLIKTFKKTHNLNKISRAKQEAQEIISRNKKIS